MKKATFLLIAVTAVVFTTACLGASQNPWADKKLIEYGWDNPATGFVRDNIRKMEQIPFDGVVIQVLQKNPDGTLGAPLGWETFSPKLFQPSEYEYAIADLRAAHSDKLTDNFIAVTSVPGSVDWFDPKWSTVAHNAGCLARVAKEGGCKGLMFDPEDYSHHNLWTYGDMSPELKKAHSLEEYSNMARQRGREFMQAINKEYPDITILTLFGPSIAESGMKQAKGNKEKAGYYLYMSFLTGMMDVATPKTTIVDGWEFSYYSRELKDFNDVRPTILKDAKAICPNPKAYEQHIRVGDAVWADSTSQNIGWHPEDFSKNFHTPAGFRETLAYAMQTSDKYTWVYSERLSWWKFDVPAPYVQALGLAHTGPGAGEPNKLPMAKTIPMAEVQTGYSDDKTFAETRKTMTEVYDFPKAGWRFKAQGKVSGEKLGWQKPGFDDSKWMPISIGKWWDEQDVKLEGTGWYRIKFTMPDIPALNDTSKKNKLFIAVGAADEAAWVWVNGVQAGAHDIGPDGWDKLFTLEITKLVHPGQENVVVIRVRNDAGAGGLWKSIKLFVLPDRISPQ